MVSGPNKLQTGTTSWMLNDGIFSYFWQQPCYTYSPFVWSICQHKQLQVCMVTTLLSLFWANTEASVSIMKIKELCKSYSCGYGEYKGKPLFWNRFKIRHLQNILLKMDFTIFKPNKVWWISIRNLWTYFLPWNFVPAHISRQCWSVKHLGYFTGSVASGSAFPRSEIHLL